MKLRILGLLILCACPPAPSPPQPDADAALLGDADPVTAACDRLAALGCPEGLNAHCTTVLAHVIDAGLEHFDPVCMATATSKESMRACPNMNGACP